MTQVVPTSAQLGLHAHLREGQERKFLAAASDDQEAAAGEAQAGQGPAEATPALARSRTGTLAAQCGSGSSELLRSARQQPGHRCLPPTARTAVVLGAPASEPASPGDVGADAASHRPVAPARPHPAPLSRGALRRSHPRQEPSAVVPHAGICAGGGPKGPSLPPSRRCRSPRRRTTSTGHARPRGESCATKS